MGSRQQVGQQLVALGRKLGEALALDDDGACSLELEDDYEALVVVTPNEEVVVFCVSVIPVFTADREALFEHLLWLNYTDEMTLGAALGLNDTRQDVVLRHSLPADRLTDDTLEPMLAALTALAKDLRPALDSWQRETAEPMERVAPQVADAPSPLLPQYRA